MRTQQPAKEIGRSLEASRPPPIRVVVADDHAMVIAGVKHLVGSETDMEVVGEAEGGRQVRQVIRALIERDAAPDVVVMDISMPDENGREATTRIRHNWPAVRVLILSMYEESSYLRALMEAGASGYVLKRSLSDELVRAIRVVAGGNLYVDPAMTSTVLSSLARPRNAAAEGDEQGVAAPESVRLTEQEENVLRMIAQGHLNKEIGIRLNISVKTVEVYKKRSMQKLGFVSRVEIIHYASARGWLT